MAAGIWWMFFVWLALFGALLWGWNSSAKIQNNFLKQACQGDHHFGAHCNNSDFSIKLFGHRRSWMLMIGKGGDQE